MPSNSNGQGSFIEYAISGHSGDSPRIPFLTFDQSRPDNEMEKLRILHEMAAHSQYTFPGDNTLEATEIAIKEVVNPNNIHELVKTKQINQKQNAKLSNSRESSGDEDSNTERYVFVVSDANFQRYNINPKKLADIMTSDSRVKVHFILIASLDCEANDIVQALPQGHGHICFESTDLPQVFRKILSEGAFDLSL